MSVTDWLLESDEPGVVLQVMRDLLADQNPPEAAHVLDGPLVRGLLAGQRSGSNEMVTLNALRILSAAK